MKELLFKYFTPYGRAERLEFLIIFCIFQLGNLLMLYVSELIMFSEPRGLFFLISLVLIISVSIRRLHDLNYSGWYFLLIFIPILNAIMILLLFFKKGKIEKNDYNYTIADKKE